MVYHDSGKHTNTWTPARSLQTSSDPLRAPKEFRLDDPGSLSEIIPDSPGPVVAAPRSLPFIPGGLPGRTIGFRNYYGSCMETPSKHEQQSLASGQLSRDSYSLGDNCPRPHQYQDCFMVAEVCSDSMTTRLIYALDMLDSFDQKNIALVFASNPRKLHMSLSSPASFS